MSVNVLKICLFGVLLIVCCTCLYSEAQSGGTKGCVYPGEKVNIKVYKQHNNEVKLEEMG